MASDAAARSICLSNQSDTPEAAALLKAMRESLVGPAPKRRDVASREQATAATGRLRRIWNSPLREPRNLDTRVGLRRVA